MLWYILNTERKLKQKENLLKGKSNKSYLQLNLRIKYTLLLKIYKIKDFITLKVPT